MALRAGYYGLSKKMLEALENGGGGKYDVVDGSVEISATDPTAVDIGFKPDGVIITASKGSNDMCHVYYAGWKTDKQLRAWNYGTYANNSVVWALPYTGVEVCGIKSIDDTGFTILPYSTDYATDNKVNYIAFKKKED